MKDKMLRFIRENNLIAPGQTIICAVSGGKDSVALLHAMCALRQTLRIDVAAAHLNHRLRGEESDRDEAFVRRLCRTLDVPLTVSGADVTARCAQTGESMEEAARVLRYAFLEGLGGPVATAHTQDDNLETVLLNLIRGTALRGLCGIPVRRGCFVRPMLSVRREEVAAYLRENDLPHVEDSSNASDAVLRNRLRHEVIPLLTRENPSLPETVFRMDEILRREDAFLDEQAASLLREASRDGGWSCAVLSSAPQAIRARAMRRLLSELEITKPSGAHVDALMHLLSSKGGTRRITLPGGQMLARVYDKLEVQREPLPSAFAPQTLNLDGTTEIRELRLRISCRFVKNYEKTTIDPCTFALKCDTINKNDPIFIRPRQAGDTIRLPGGTRSLKKLLIDRRVPAAQRNLVPVLADQTGVILVFPFAVSQARQAQPGEAAVVIHFAHEKEYIQKEDTQ